MDQQNFNQSSESDGNIGVERLQAKKRSSFAKLLVIVLILAVVGGFSAGAGAMFVKNYLNSDEPAEAPVLTTQPAVQTNTVITGEGSADIANIVESVGPSVISITSTVSYRDFFNMERTAQSSGSGVIYAVNAEAVDILTNEHVVADAKEVMVQLKPDQYFKAEIVGKDKSTDLAIIRIPASEIPTEVLSTVKAAPFGDSDQLRVGEPAIAIGNPLGYNSTVTVGVISAVDREIRDKNSLKLIQTDAAINPGNSGGALVNARGEVIGINTIKIASAEVEGIGFAIPSNSAVPIVNELASKGFVSRPYLGIYGMEINAETAEAYDMPVGIYVRGVIEGSGAEAGGIEAEDVIISVDDTRVETMTQLSDFLNQKQIGDTVNVRLVRGGRTLELEVVLTDANS
ncbi:S1C family serine protease [Acidaminobacter hydrogenoformans]|uniref:Serine protease Do n=1 Tax=Acidaminobacter hydrogenoformans DSM 2784 TaxID=1120920 RepID=A0A1G5RT35_9FIRM|nr:trypsin-like peptidase domain-containing protein [Acidaminobacter hydrogenoformans]SCZ77233.1 serine protease Do [Acidaminobacter hydrogenoformans DSM 2784]